MTTVLDVQTRVSDLYSQPFDQVQEQLRLLIEKVKERQESELINNVEYGLLASTTASQRLKSRKGAPAPDDLDELLTKVWKEPAFFLAHPRTIAAFGRECTRRGVPPPTVTLFGNPFLTWRCVPLVPSDKVRIEAGADGIERSKILLIRTGEKKQGVVGLFQPGVPGEVAPSLSVRFMGINRKAIASYLISLYCSLAALFAPTGIGVVYGKQALLDATPPWQGGGNMIADVTFERTIYQAAPERFEAGAGNIADAVGLGAAIDYLDRIGMEAIHAHEHELIEATVAGLTDIAGVRLIGAPRERAGGNERGRHMAVEARRRCASTKRFPGRRRWPRMASCIW